MFEIKLRPSHPTGVYHRGGIEFNKTVPVKMANVSHEIKADPNLIVKEADPTHAGPLPKSGAGPLDSTIKK
jgi:hypothetical protein